jgi:hypothetical protein
VAAGTYGDPTGTIQWSTDALNWNTSITGGFSNDGSYTGVSVAYSSTLNQFVAIGMHTKPQSTIQSSTDGSNWQGSVSGGFNTVANAYTGHVVYSEARQLWVATSSDSNSPRSTIQTSTDGLNWQGIQWGGFEIDVPGSNEGAGVSIAFSAVLGQWVATGFSATSSLSLQYSYDASNWFPAVTGGFEVLPGNRTEAYGVMYSYSSSNWYAIGGSSTNSNSIQVSSDGSNWYSSASSGGFGGSKRGYGIAEQYTEIVSQPTIIGTSTIIAKNINNRPVPVLNFGQSLTEPTGSNVITFDYPYYPTPPAVTVTGSNYGITGGDYGVVFFVDQVTTSNAVVTSVDNNDGGVYGGYDYWWTAMGYNIPVELPESIPEPSSVPPAVQYPNRPAINFAGCSGTVGGSVGNYKVLSATVAWTPVSGATGYQVFIIVDTSTNVLNTSLTLPEPTTYVGTPLFTDQSGLLGSGATSYTFTPTGFVNHVSLYIYAYNANGRSEYPLECMTYKGTWGGPATDLNTVYRDYTTDDYPFEGGAGLGSAYIIESTTLIPKPGNPYAGVNIENKPMTVAVAVSGVTILSQITETQSTITMDYSVDAGTEPYTYAYKCYLDPPNANPYTSVTPISNTFRVNIDQDGASLVADTTYNIILQVDNNYGGPAFSAVFAANTSLPPPPSAITIADVNRGVDFIGVSVVGGDTVTSWATTATPTEGGEPVTVNVAPDLEGNIVITGLAVCTTYNIQTIGTDNYNQTADSNTLLDISTECTPPPPSAITIADVNRGVDFIGVSVVGGDTVTSWATTATPTEGGEPVTVNVAPDLEGNIQITGLALCTTYNIQTIGTDDYSQSTDSNTLLSVSTSCTPPPPSAITISLNSIGTTSILITVSGGDTATSWATTATPTGGGAPVTVNTAPIDDIITIDGLTSCTAYDIQTVGTDDNSQSTDSNTLTSISTGCPVSNVVITGTISRADTDIVMSYTISGTEPITYSCTVSPGGIRSIVTSGGQFGIDGLEPGIEYSFVLTGYNDYGPPSDSPSYVESTTGGIPPPPSPITITGTTGGSTFLSFSVSGGDSAVSWFTTAIPDGGILPTIDTIAGPEGEQRIIIITGLTANTTYSVKTIGTDAYSQATESDTISLSTQAEPPGPPTAVTITGQDYTLTTSSTLVLNYTGGVGALSWSLAGGILSALLIDTPTVGKFTISELIANTVYNNIILNAINDTGTTSSSGYDNALTGPSNFTISRIGSPSENQYALNIGVDSIPDGITFEYTLDDGSRIACIPGGGENSFNIIGLASGTSYTVIVYAININNTATASNTLSTATSGPKKPTIVSNTATYNSLTYTFTGGPYSGIFTFQYSLDGSLVRTDVVLDTPNSFTVGELIPDTPYTIVLFIGGTAYDDLGEESDPYTTSTNRFTLTTPPSSVGITSVTIGYTNAPDLSNIPGGSVTVNDIISGFPINSVDLIIDASSITITNLNTGQTYSFTVSYVASGGAYSDTATPNPYPDVTPSAPVFSIQIVNVDPTTISLTYSNAPEPGGTWSCSLNEIAISNTPGPTDPFFEVITGSSTINIFNLTPVTVYDIRILNNASAPAEFPLTVGTPGS